MCISVIIYFYISLMQKTDIPFFIQVILIKFFFLGENRKVKSKQKKFQCIYIKNFDLSEKVCSEIPKGVLDLGSGERYLSKICI